MVIPYGLERDGVFFIQIVAILTILYVTTQIGRRAREIGVWSSTLGFCILLFHIMLFQILVFLAIFYAVDERIRDALLNWGNIIIFGGLTQYVFFLEFDQKRVLPLTVLRKWPYWNTIFCLAGMIGMIPLTLTHSNLRFIFFVLIIIPAILSTRQFIARFSIMEMSRQNHAPQRFYLGLAITCFSNFLPVLHLFIGYTGFGIASGVSVGGTVLLVSAWGHFPRLVDLQWLLNLDRLMVYKPGGGQPLYEEIFRHSTRETSVPSLALVSGALTGINSMIGEVLASKGHLKEIEYANQKILFYCGQQIICVLIVSVPSQEYWYRLELFGISFEKQFADHLTSANFSTSYFQEAVNLTRKYFS